MLTPWSGELNFYPYKLGQEDIPYITQPTGVRWLICSHKKFLDNKPFQKAWESAVVPWREQKSSAENFCWTANWWSFSFRSLEVCVLLILFLAGWSGCWRTPSKKGCIFLRWLPIQHFPFTKSLVTLLLFNHLVTGQMVKKGPSQQYKFMIPMKLEVQLSWMKPYK